LTTVVVEGPYEKIIEKLIKKGYAGSKTEVVRQALRAYDRQLEDEKKEEEEYRLVSRKVAKIMKEIESGKRKVYPWEDVKKELGIE